MKKFFRISIPILLTIAIILITCWYFLSYDKEFTRDLLLEGARYFESQGNLKVAAWFYDGAYLMASDNDAVAIELAEQYKADGNYTKAEYVLSHALEDGGGIELYIALCKTYVEQDKLIDAVYLLDNISNQQIKSDLDQIRPAAPSVSLEPGFYTQYVSVGFATEDGNHLYVNPEGEYPSMEQNAYVQPITLVAGENTLYSIAVSENGLVSPFAIYSYTVGGVIEELDFKDASIEAEVRKILDAAEDKTLYSNDLWGITEFVVPAGAANYEDLSKFTYLKKLSISDGKTGQLQYISGLSYLTSLNITNTAVSSDEVKVIGSLPQLTQLTLSNCGLTTISGLESAYALTDLNLNNNTLRNISALSSMPMLQSLYLADNALTDLKALSNLQALSILDVSRNTIHDISPLTGLTNLTQLNISSNKISDLSSIDKLVKLVVFRADGNILTDISKLAACVNIMELKLSNNSIEDLSAIATMKKLAHLDFSHNLVTALPAFASDCELVSIDGSYNLLTNLDALAGLPRLNNIFMDYNEEIESVEPLASCPVLILVNVYGTKVTEVDMLTDQSIIVNYNPTLED